MLREDTHQAACHISCCLGLEWLQDDIITEPVSTLSQLSGTIWKSTGPRCSTVSGICALYNLLFALPPSGCITNLAEIQEEQTEDCTKHNIPDTVEQRGPVDFQMVPDNCDKVDHQLSGLAQ